MPAYEECSPERGGLEPQPQSVVDGKVIEGHFGWDEAVALEAAGLDG